MKKYFPYCFLLMAGIITGNTMTAQNEFNEGIELLTEQAILPSEIAAMEDSLAQNTVKILNPQEVYDSLPQPEVNYDVVNFSFTPRIFSGYRKVHNPHFAQKEFYDNLKGLKLINGDLVIQEVIHNDSIALLEVERVSTDQDFPTVEVVEPDSISKLPGLLVFERPEWFDKAIRNRTAQEDLKYIGMLYTPASVEYAYWDLPVPPVLLVEDRSFMAFLRKQDIPEPDPEEAILPEVELKKRNWLHKVGAQLQFSQAYISPNWYQGGNSYLSMLFGFNWNVTLNQVYHPKLLFQSDLTYKLAFTSNPKGSYHKYTISEDNFQYNLNTGLKAAKDWYYSFNLQFKTQLFNNFAQDSPERTASFLSPGDLNLGLGMSYNHTNKLKTFKFTLTISPLSYNLKTCISDKVDHLTYSIPQDKKAKSEIGSNIEFNMEWAITTNISYKTRLFTFTDYHYFLGDWQNTFNFDINKFLSTQIFVNLRYDGSTENYSKWKKFMMKELLSFGLSYTFSTKP
ncbi:MAG: DUF3078 domain-containing protein [Muribaculaceae bacterium]|nr:DUF3078 domain-containing protein [Muribaculaceae bacterium]